MQGVNIDGVYYGHSALQAACQNGHTEPVKLLLFLKADPELQVTNYHHLSELILGYIRVGN